MLSRHAGVHVYFVFMIIRKQGLEILISVFYLKEGAWREAFLSEDESGYVYKGNHISVSFLLRQSPPFLTYSLGFVSAFATRLRVALTVPGANDAFHLIPGNIFGNNNAEKAIPGQFPNLVTGEDASPSSSPEWEFRADRATHPVSIVCTAEGAFGISIEPYTEVAGGYIRNGLFAKLPVMAGVSLGYANYPLSFINKGEFRTETAATDHAHHATAKGTIYICPGHGRTEAHTIIEHSYHGLREIPAYSKDLRQAAFGLLDGFRHVSWSPEWREYTNMRCTVPGNPVLKPFRPLVEIGWTAGGVLAFPFLCAEKVLSLESGFFAGCRDGWGIFDALCGQFNEQSGLLNEVVRTGPDPFPEDPLDGWWTYFNIARSCHCSYTNGHAAYYLFRAAYCLNNWKQPVPPAWIATGSKVLDTIVALQRADGSFGYTYSPVRREVRDWEGFAGCWFVPALAYASLVGVNKGYLDAAARALDYYSRFVAQLSCWGSPMDTWKSVDQEGNLAFIRGARLMHQITGEEKYLAMLLSGARYEYLWRYGFKTRPEYAPLKGSHWNSCGGSVTSVSNPHIHPMGLVVTDDLEYLFRHTGDEYHKKRADDGIAWIMNTMELYPETMGYGRYGVLSERFCPSDGLLIEKYSDGTPASTWFSYNGWACANALEAILVRLHNQTMAAQGSTSVEYI